MRTNSILTCLNASSTLSEIKLLLSHDIERRKTVLLLEGEDDVRLFKFLVRKNVTLIKAYGASSSIDHLLPQHFKDEPRVIAVRDRDYQKAKQHERIFYCDYSCAEMMLVADDETFDKVATNHYRGELDYISLRYGVLKSLYYISLIRKLSATRRWGLRIGDVDLSAIVSAKRQTGLSEVIAFLNAYNKHNPIDAARANLLHRQKPDTGELTDYLMITNGHDFVEALCVYCTETASNSVKKRLNDKVLSAALRLSYSRSSFQKTRLYRALLAYATANGLEIV